MGGDETSIKSKKGSDWRFIGGAAFAAKEIPSDGSSEPKDAFLFQVGVGAARVNLWPKPLSFVFVAPNYTQVSAPDGDTNQLGVMIGGGLDFLVAPVYVAVNPGVNLENGDFTLGGEIGFGAVLKLKKSFSVIPSFKFAIPDLLSDGTSDDSFFGVQLLFSYGRPSEN